MTTTVFRCCVVSSIVLAFSARTASAAIAGRSLALSNVSKWGLPDTRIHKICSLETLKSLRGGQVDDEDTDDDEEEEDEVEGSEEEEEDEEEEEEEEDEIEIDTAVVEYDTPLELPATIQMGTMLGLMVLTKRLDMYDPKIVRFGRFIFIAFVVLQQIFCLYVRVQAKLNNDRTPIKMTNPLSGILNAQLQNQDMIKNLASSFLSTQSTIMEYDLKQAKNMNGGILLNMAFMWFLHFKMGQTQPLFFQTVQGLTNLVFNPLFQCYVLGRNLERPFKVGALAQVPAEAEDAETAQVTDEVVTAEADEEEASLDDTEAISDEKEDEESDEEEEFEEDEEDEEAENEGEHQNKTVTEEEHVTLYETATEDEKVAHNDEIADDEIVTLNAEGAEENILAQNGNDNGVE